MKISTALNRIYEKKLFVRAFQRESEAQAFLARRFGKN